MPRSREREKHEDIQFYTMFDFSFLPGIEHSNPSSRQAID
ncbi:MAG: hypothetical protein K0S58_2922, partial [Nitrospira sp.]|nr:hypothetical protein [Nitrospira sp.]